MTNNRSKSTPRFLIVENVNADLWRDDLATPRREFLVTVQATIDEVEADLWNRRRKQREGWWDEDESPIRDSVSNWDEDIDHVKGGGVPGKLRATPRYKTPIPVSVRLNGWRQLTDLMKDLSIRVDVHQQALGWRDVTSPGYRPSTFDLPVQEGDWRELPAPVRIPTVDEAFHTLFSKSDAGKRGVAVTKTDPWDDLLRETFAKRERPLWPRDRD